MIQEQHSFEKKMLDAPARAQSLDNFYTISAEGQESRAGHRLTEHPSLCTKKASADHFIHDKYDPVDCY